MLPISAIPVSTAHREQAYQDFEDACGRAQTTHDQIARRLGISPEQLHQQLMGQGHLSMSRLYQLRDDEVGKRFLWAYLPALAKSWNVPEVEIAMRLCDLAQTLGISVKGLLVGFINSVQKRMARAELRERAREERGA